MTVGQEIRRKREAKGWSQAKLGVLSGAGPSGISQIETGRRNPSAGTLQRIADALEVEVRDLFPLEQAPLPELEGAEQRREYAERLLAAVQSEDFQAIARDRVLADRLLVLHGIVDRHLTAHSAELGMVEEERRAPVFLGAVFVAAQKWQKSILNTDIHKLPGITEAALDLLEQIRPGLDPHSPRVAEEDYLLALDTLSLLNMAVRQAISRIKDEADPETTPAGLGVPAKTIEGWENRLEKLAELPPGSLEQLPALGIPHNRGTADIAEENARMVHEAYDVYLQRLAAKVPATKAAQND